MSALQLTGIVLCVVIPTIGWILLFRQCYRFYKGYRVGREDPTRTSEPGARTAALLREFLGHTRMARLPVVALAHWFVALSFIILFATLVNAFFQLVWADFRLPVIGHFPPFEWLIELFAWGAIIGILTLIVIRQKNHPRSAPGEHGRRSRFFGSTWWQAYFVESVILVVGICIFLLRTLEAALLRIIEPGVSIPLHFPLTGWAAGMWSGMSEGDIRQAIYLVATIKILVSFAWMITVALQPTMGVAWHRFLAFFNIWFKRHPNRTSLGELQPMRVDGKPVTLETIEAMGESEDEEESVPAFGVGKAEDFTWKQLLDFSTCTECGRCQSQCPAWNTDKPLSPKLLMMTMREHAAAKTPWLQAVGAGASRDDAPQVASIPLVGQTGYTLDEPLSAYTAHGPAAVIDEDVLWSCTSCGACVEQCPVDIEHVDAIVDMRRHQVLIESAFPQELGGLFKNLEGKGNPWGMQPRARLEWAKDLPFSVPVVGQDVESLDDVDYLFWVGCAGAYEDRAKKTSRAVAELLHTADVKFAVLGNGETCTGDSARRAGNEILFQMLAAQNVETLNEANAKTIIVTCAHCFNTLKNEYPQVGGHYTVLHHTQVLNRLVRDGRLTPVNRPAATPVASTAKDVASAAPTVTYHDPCYLGRHNGVYAPPRELIGALPGVELREMPRHGERSFCCGAGGARMWMEEKLGTRINVNRTQEAVATGADRIAVGCPFCRVMLSDGLTAEVSEGRAREDVEVVDIAQMLLSAVRAPEKADEQAPTESTVAAAEPGETPEEAAAASEAPQTKGGGAGAEAAVAAAATGAAAVAAEAADPWDDDATPAAAAQPAPATPPAPTAQPVTDAADPWDDDAAAPAAAPAPTQAQTAADPWDDEPAAAAQPAAATPTAPAQAQTSAQPTTDVADPWDDEPAAAAQPAAATPTAPAQAQAQTSAQPTDVADPWDDDDTSTRQAPAQAAAPTAAPTATPAQAVPAPVTADEVPDPWDEPDQAPAPAASPASEAAAPSVETATVAPATAPATDEVPAPATDEVPDPWDEPDQAPAPAASPAPPATAPVTEAPRAEETPAPVSDEVPDPWDEPDDVRTPTTASATDAPARTASAAPAAQAPAAAPDGAPGDVPAASAQPSDDNRPQASSAAPLPLPVEEVPDPWDE